MNRNQVAILALFLTLACFALPTAAYTRQSADGAKSVKLRWKESVIPIAVSASMLSAGPNIRPESDIEGALRRSLGSWENVAGIKFTEVFSDRASVSPIGKNGDGVNLITVGQTPENLLLFGNDPDGMAARTRVFYNSRGYITEADIVLNPYQEFSTDGSIGTYDLEATLTHEIGHLLGLDHSTIIGATMYASQGKNGVNNLPGFWPRTLSEDDIAGIRSIYGADPESEFCCGSVGGIIMRPDGRSADDAEIWLEESSGGRVIAGGKTAVGGKFLIEGLPEGEYVIGVKDSGDGNLPGSLAPQQLGLVEIASGKKSRFSRTLGNLKRNHQVLYVGFNGQLADMAVPLSAGKSFFVFAGGTNLDAGDVDIGFTSPYFRITPNSISKQNYGNGISVISFEVNLNSRTPSGDFSFFVVRNSIVEDVLIGSLSVENEMASLTGTTNGSDE